MRVLLTGFEPFGGSDVNPSGLAVTLLSERGIEGIDLDIAILPVTWSGAIPQLTERFESLQPDAVVMSGQSGRSHVALEKVGVNLRNGKDNEGAEARGQPVVPGGPPAYFSTADLGPLAENLAKDGLPARVSYTAGTFLCNAVLYGLLHHMAERDLEIPALFVHVPMLPLQASRHQGRDVPPSMSLEDTTAALQRVVRDLAFRKSG